jgi:hypothetical protein
MTLGELTLGMERVNWNGASGPANPGASRPLHS